jgi:hypothetical protein
MAFLSIESADSCEPTPGCSLSFAGKIGGLAGRDRSRLLVMNDEYDEARGYACSKQDNAQADGAWRAVDCVSDNFPFTLFGLPEFLGWSCSHAENLPTRGSLAHSAVLDNTGSCLIDYLIFGTARHTSSLRGVAVIGVPTGARNAGTVPRRGTRAPK